MIRCVESLFGLSQGRLGIDDIRRFRFPLAIALVDQPDVLPRLCNGRLGHPDAVVRLRGASVSDVNLIRDTVADLLRLGACGTYLGASRLQSTHAFAASVQIIVQEDAASADVGVLDA